MRRMTIGLKILGTLKKCNRSVTFRQLAGWHHRYCFGSVYSTLHRLKRIGLVASVGNDRFKITDAGIQKLQEQI